MIARLLRALRRPRPARVVLLEEADLEEVRALAARWQAVYTAGISGVEGAVVPDDETGFPHLRGRRILAANEPLDSPEPRIAVLSGRAGSTEPVVWFGTYTTDTPDGMPVLAEGWWTVTELLALLLRSGAVTRDELLGIADDEATP